MQDESTLISYTLDTVRFKALVVGAELKVIFLTHFSPAGKRSSFESQKVPSGLEIAMSDSQRKDCLKKPYLFFKNLKFNLKNLI